MRPQRAWRWCAGMVCTMLACGVGRSQDVSAAPVQALLSQPVPLAELPSAARERVRQLMEKPTLAARGPLELFRGRMDLYQWLLDHPDRGVVAWRRLGQKCTEIYDRGQGRFGWTDGQGSDIRWDTVYHSPSMRVWLAEGVVKPGPFLPAVSLQAVAVIRCHAGRDTTGRPLIHHQGEVFLHTDSKAVAVATELLGQSAQDIAAQAVSQMELFYSAIIWYLDRHPERAEVLLAAGIPAA